MAGSRSGKPATGGRGAARRSALVAAAAELLLEHGPQQVSARAVAARAQVPLSAVSYYFEALPALLAAAVDEVTAQHLVAAERVLDRLRRSDSAEPGGAGPADDEATARAVVAVVVGPHRGRAGVAALYARALSVAGAPDRAAQLARWDDRVAELVAGALELAGRPAPPRDVRTVLALVDGLLVSAVLHGRSDPQRWAAGQLAPRLAAVLAAA